MSVRRAVVEAGGDGWRDADAGAKGEFVDHGTDGGGLRVDPVEIGEVATAGVVIDVDGEGGADSFELGGVKAAAFQ